MRFFRKPTPIGSPLEDILKKTYGANSKAILVLTIIKLVVKEWVIALYFEDIIRIC
jgi:hypothetical protein